MPDLSHQEVAPQGQITDLLRTWRQASSDADQLYRIVRQTLRQMAVQRMARNAGLAGALWQPTLFVDDAYVKLLREHGEIVDRAHFFALASMAMRRLVIDWSRCQSAARRDAARTVAMPMDLLADHPLSADQLLDLDEALSRFADEDPRAARMIELRYFGGRTIDETAEILGVSHGTVEGDWAYGRTRLAELLGAWDDHEA